MTPAPKAAVHRTQKFGRAVLHKAPGAGKNPFTALHLPSSAPCAVI